MPPGPLSRYRNLEPLTVQHAARGTTRSLPVRRPEAGPPPIAGRHRMTGYEPLDALARRYLGVEELLWRLRDANGGRPPDGFAVGELLDVPGIEDVTRVRRSG
jgi:hypothetical protein